MQPLATTQDNYRGVSTHSTENRSESFTQIQVQVARKNHSLLVSGSSANTPYQRVKEFCTGLLLNLFISFYTCFNNKFIFDLLFKLSSQKHNLNQKSLQLNVLMCYIHFFFLFILEKH